ncbi:hypothetical protein ACL7TT_19850 [Microbulbifer sp. 2304DJ12-6]|uniref:hypothetical protein n=1 Tax=Microbulbifer sp. 2304DJ12-6 TaxID=3233340 RepID=UPI0039B06F8E
MNIKCIVLVIISAYILGCAAAGVPYTSDPTEKLQNAYYLMNNEGRALPAEKLGLEALSDFKKVNNTYGEAEAEHFLGTFYKSQVYRSYSDFYIKHGEYDPTIQNPYLIIKRPLQLLKETAITGAFQSPHSQSVMLMLLMVTY